MSRPSGDRTWVTTHDPSTLVPGKKSKPMTFIDYIIFGYGRKLRNDRSEDIVPKIHSSSTLPLLLITPTIASGLAFSRSKIFDLYSTENSFIDPRNIIMSIYLRCLHFLIIFSGKVNVLRFNPKLSNFWNCLAYKLYFQFFKYCYTRAPTLIPTLYINNITPAVSTSHRVITYKHQPR